MFHSVGAPASGAGRNRRSLRKVMAPVPKVTASNSAVSEHRPKIQYWETDKRIQNSFLSFHRFRMVLMSWVVSLNLLYRINGFDLTRESQSFSSEETLSFGIFNKTQDIFSHAYYQWEYTWWLRTIISSRVVRFMSRVQRSRSAKPRQDQWRPANR